MRERNDSISITPAEFKKLSGEEKILKIASGFIPPEGTNESKALDLVFSKLETKTPEKTFRIKPYLFAAAAILLLLIGIPAVLTINSSQKQITGAGQHIGISLPDGTIVTVNANSKIAWSKKDFTQNRSLTLKGEAFFDVKKGSKFEIKTQGGMVEILGTQLNVFARENELRVSCISGKVKVTAKDSEQIILPGEETELVENVLVKKIFNNNSPAMWKEGLFYFDDKPLVAIFDELERQFGVTVKLNGNEDRNATVTFSNKNLKEALDVICLPLELSYEIKKENRIFVNSKK